MPKEEEKSVKVLKAVKSVRAKKSEKVMKSPRRVLKKEGALAYDKETLSTYLISTVKEVIEVSRKPMAVLDKSGNPTGAVEYQSATVLKACELMAKLMGSIKEEEGKGISVQIVSYKDIEETQISS